MKRTEISSDFSAFLLCHNNIGRFSQIFTGVYSVKILSYRMDQKLSTKFFFISSPNTDGFYSFYISEGSAATQLRCDCMFGKHFITNFPQDAPVKNFENRSIFGKDMDRVCGLLFGPQCTCR